MRGATTSPGSVRPVFIGVLRQLTPKDAELLDDRYDSCTEKQDQSVPPWSEIMIKRA
jgi:hypothetical protein